MRIHTLTLRHFRNYEVLQQSFSPGINLLIGENGQGKTNLMEAIYLLATSKSMRASRDQEMIGWESGMTVVSGEVERDTQPGVTLEVGISRNDGKSLSVNGQTCHRVTEFVSLLQAVTFCAEDIEIVRGEPDKRRRFLNLEISQMSPRYCQNIGVYRRVLEQRNQLLRSARDHPEQRAPAHLEIWTERLCKEGAAIIDARAQFLERLAELLKPIHARLTGTQETIGINYRACVELGEGQRPSVERIEELLQERARDREENEVRRGATLVGPHRDEIVFLIDGQPARKFGSQGQQRTLTLSIKLAERLMMEGAAGEPPVLLLDDVLSELDEKRREQVLEEISDSGQIFISATEAELLSGSTLKRASIYRVGNGGLEEVKRVA